MELHEASGNCWIDHFADAKAFETDWRQEDGLHTDESHGDAWMAPHVGGFLFFGERFLYTLSAAE
jgi:hypothetical protein